MRLRRCLCLVLLCAVICCALFSVSASAAVVEQYSYNGFVLPKIPDFWYEHGMIVNKGNEFYFVCYDGQRSIDESGQMNMYDWTVCKLVDKEWVKGTYTAEWVTPIWTSEDILYVNSDDIFLAASDPVITLIQVPDPPIGTTELNPVLNAYIDQINVRLVVTVLAGAAGVSVVLVFLWWGVRKVTGALIKAFKKGKIRI